MTRLKQILILFHIFYSKNFQSLLIFLFVYQATAELTFFGKTLFDPYKAGIFKGIFSWRWEGVILYPPPKYFKKNLSNINIT